MRVETGWLKEGSGLGPPVHLPTLSPVPGRLGQRELVPFPPQTSGAHASDF